jgi:hypothetical protein
MAEEVIGSWRKLHNEKRHNLYYSPNIIRVTISRRMGHVACMGEMNNYKNFGRKPEGKRPLGRFRHRMEDRSLKWSEIE